MNRLLFGLAALPFLGGFAMAAQPIQLSDGQMDTVTAGFDLQEVECQNTGCVLVAVNKAQEIQPGGSSSNPCPTCFIVIENEYYKNNAGPLAMQFQSQFGGLPHLTSPSP